jgi:hypothetical protein
MLLNTISAFARILLVFLLLTQVSLSWDLASHYKIYVFQIFYFSV